MQHNIWIYLGIMAVTIFAIRALPLTLIRRQITNRTLRSFLYYVPSVTLAVMTFPAIIEATQSPWAGLVALIIGGVMAWCGAGLFPVVLACCASAFVLELFLI